MRRRAVWGAAALLGFTLLVMPVWAQRLKAQRQRARQDAMKMIDIVPGRYPQGDDAGFWDEKPAHQVTLSRAFRLAARPISNAQFEQFAPSHRAFRGQHNTPGGDNDPVRFISWQDATDFCRWLSAREGKPFRLPSEAEWEAAFRTEGARLKGGREVENWCADWYGPYAAAPQTDPQGFESGEMRSVRGGSWRAESDRRPSFTARLGALPQDRNAAIGLRVAEGAAGAGTLLTQRRVPLWARDVEQKPFDWKPATDAKQPYFAPPLPYVRIAPGSHGPLFSRHNHVPALVACANGDLLALWYSTETEPGRELLIAAARLRRGHTAWDAADVFWDTPGRNDHAPALWADAAGTLFHFNGVAAEGGWDDLALTLRQSRDNGRTWSAARFLDRERAHGNMPIASPFQSRDGALYLPCDESPTQRGGTLLHVSRDGGQSWRVLNRGARRPHFGAGESGAWIAGIHAGVDEWNGSLVAVGRGNDIDGHLALSVSRDGGASWRYSATPFPPIGGGQRPVLRRLREGALLLVSFTPGSPFVDARGETFTGHGIFAALSFDGGQSWPVRKLLTDGQSRTFDGQGWTGPFTTDATHAEPKGYLTAIQTPDGIIQLLSSGVHYRFNAAWLRQPN